MSSTDEELLVPLSEVRKLKRNNSRGPGSELELSHHGEADTLDYRLQAVCPEKKKKISLWHDISLYHMDPVTKAETPYLNFVCEIPKFTRYVNAPSTPSFARESRSHGLESSLQKKVRDCY
jgi:inorganic pyrophosphatase